MTHHVLRIAVLLLLAQGAVASASDAADSAAATVTHVALQEQVCEDAHCAAQIESSSVAEAPVSAPPQRLAVGTATRSLLQLQASGAHGSTHSYPMTGEVASKVYERYVNSFAHPIPEQLASAIAKSSK